MGMFKKKEAVPSIPSAPGIPSIGEQKKQLPELPSFPASSADNVNQEMVKSAVADMPSPGENEVIDEAQYEPVEEVQQGEQMLPPRTSVIPNPPTIQEPAPIVSNPTTAIQQRPQFQSPAPTPAPAPARTSLTNEPIFIRIDKFQQAQKHFDLIKEKLDKIELTLGKIKDVKSREEIEIKGWTEDVAQIKAMLSEVDESIFEQL